MWAGLKDGTIDFVATDHATHTLDEKHLHYGQAPSGMPGVQTSLTLMLNEVSKDKVNNKTWYVDLKKNLYDKKSGQNHYNKFKFSVI